MDKRISLESLTKKEKFFRFQRMNNYVIPAGIKYQIVQNEKGTDVGIAISTNGRKDFRMEDQEIIYWYASPYLYRVSSPLFMGKTRRLE